MGDRYDKPDLDFRVTLRNSKDLAEYITFEATPDLIETRNVNYKTIDPVHAPGQIMAYASSASRNFNLSSVRLISRTETEAQQNLEKLWILRGWTMPTFGKSTLTDSQRQRRLAESNFLRGQAESQARGDLTDSQAETQRQQFYEALQTGFGGRGNELRGSPPAVLLLSAYSRDRDVGTGAMGLNERQGHINRVPVVIQNISIPYPSDVDYIPSSATKIPMPTILSIDMTLMETHSPREYEQFSLEAFKLGVLTGF